MSYQDITDDQIMTTLAEVVGEAPETTYRAPVHQRVVLISCYYVHTPAPDSGNEPTPGCLIGHVLNRLGVPLDELRKLERRSAGAVMDELGIGSQAVRDAMDAAQFRQDSRQTWAVALEHAERAMPQAKENA